MTALTVSELIRQAYVLAQIWDPGEEQPGYQAEQGLLTLNNIISNWSSVGTLIPAYKTITVALTANNFLYPITPPITDIIEANVIDAANAKWVLAEANLQRFNTFNFPLCPGRPAWVYLEAKTSDIQLTSNLYFYPTPDASYTATLYVKQVITQFEYSDVMTILPLYMFKPLLYQLAKDTADIYLTTLSERFDGEYTNCIETLKGVNRKDLSVQVANDFYEGARRLRPWNIYTG